jgi:hypothetical protein
VLWGGPVVGALGCLGALTGFGVVQLLVCEITQVRVWPGVECSAVAGVVGEGFPCGGLVYIISHYSLCAGLLCVREFTQVRV